LTAVSHESGSGLNPSLEAPKRLAALRLAALTVGAGAGLATYAAAGTGALGLLLALCLGAAAVASPDLVTVSAARRGESSLLQQLPDFVDLLAASLSAGIPLEDALDTCASVARAPLQPILVRVRMRVAAGEGPAVALAAEAADTGVDAFASVGRIVEQARRHGVPAAPSLVVVADDARARARASLLARAGRAGPLASLVLALVIAPACVLALIVAVLGGFSLSAGWTGPG